MPPSYQGHWLNFLQNRELQSTDLRVRQQALLLLADVLHKRENLAAAIKEGITSTLQDLLKDDDFLVRERAAKVLCNIARKCVCHSNALMYPF